MAETKLSTHTMKLCFFEIKNLVEDVIGKNEFH